MAQAYRPHRPHNFRALSKPKPIHKYEHKHYWPYIPVALLVLGTVLLSLIQPASHGRVLSYATNLSESTLLDATNNERTKNKSGDLSLNTELEQAAQAKANDMVTRNYWAHFTPDGKAPWTFIDNTGYHYQKAGENLAYGFATSTDTINGWMNSTSHRENMLDNNFTEVGFGFASSADFNKAGEETVVVAMYARPEVLGAATPSNFIGTSAAQPINTDNPSKTEPASQITSRLGTITSGQLPWIVFVVGLMTGVSLALLLAKYAVGIRHLIRDSEQFVLRHPMLDLILVAVVFVGTFLSQTTGVIR